MADGARRMRAPQPGELWRAFAAVAGAHPRRRVIEAVEGGAAWNARELAAQAERRAAEAGFSEARGGCVAFAPPTSPDWVVTFLAAQRAGVAVLPLERGGAGRDWRDEAAMLGATHAFDGGALIALKPRTASAVAWNRIAAGKVTSGSTTGRPTVVPCRASHLIADGENIIRTMGIRPRDRNLAILPLGHSYGLGNLVMPLILQGTGLVTAASYVPRQVLEWIPAHGVTVFPSVPVVLGILAGIDGDFGLRGLRLVISAGAPLPPSVAEEFRRRFRLTVHNFYGSSETGGICFDARGMASRTGRAVGRPMAGVAVRIRRDGRIEVSGAAVARPGGRCALSDLGEWTPDGELRVIGRATPMANIGGRKVNPVEIEEALRDLPGVTAAWVGVRQQEDRDHLTAAVESRRARKEIVAELAAKIARWKQPRQLVVARKLPRNARGKLDVAALRSWFD